MFHATVACSRRRAAPAFLALLLASAIPALGQDSAAPPPGYTPRAVPATVRSGQAGAAQSADVLLVQSALPWNRDSDAVVLSSLGYSYDTADMSQIPTLDLTAYQVILIANDQNQAFYDYYAQNAGFFETYVRSGGVLVFFACDMGWASGDLTTPLPGGVLTANSYECNNTIADDQHPIVTGELSGGPPLANTDTRNSYCSHGHFPNVSLLATQGVISNLHVLLRGASSQQPTLVEYSLDRGTVIASMNTWEYAYYNTSGTVNGCERGAFGYKALDDVFRFAFTRAGSYENTGLKVDVYPEDSWLPKRPVLYKHQGDLIDVVATISNNGSSSQSGVSLALTLDAALVDPGFLQVYKRPSAESIALRDGGDELVPDGQYTDNGASTGSRIVTMPGLVIPVSDAETKWNDFVFRLRLRNPLSPNTSIDATASISGEGVTPASEKLSDGGPVKVIAAGKLILTNRELMYRAWARLDTNPPTLDQARASEVNTLWDEVYRVASKNTAVVYFVDKYDRTDGDNAQPLLSWFSDRRTLAFGSGGTYTYGADPAINDDPGTDANDTQEEETRVNQVAARIKALLKDFLDRSGGISKSGRFVALLGGDAILPFYRVFDPEHRQPGEASSHPMPVNRTDASNNYLWTDLYFRDYDGLGWGEGEVEELYVGRVTGASPSAIQKLLVSSDRTVSSSASVVKLENNMRNCELDDFADQAEDRGYTVVSTIGSTSLDVDHPSNCAPWLAVREWQSQGTPLNTTADVAVWDSGEPATGDFKKLFTGAASTSTFDVMRLMCHGDVEGVYGSGPVTNTYFTGSDLNGSAKEMSASFSGFQPFFVFDACLVGIVDGDCSADLFNALLPLGTRGLLGASSITITPTISNLNDEFSESFLKGDSAGKALARADKSFGGAASRDALTRFQMNLFGLPWASLTPPERRGRAATSEASAHQRGLRDHGRIARSVVVAQPEAATSRKTVAFDSSSYATTAVGAYQVVQVAGFRLLATDPLTPSVPIGDVRVRVPLDAIITSVTAAFASPVDLGHLEIPATRFPSPGGAANLTPEYVSSPRTLGVYPPAQYFHKVADLGGYREVIVSVLPLLFDTATRSTTLYRSGSVTVDYSTPNKGIVRQFSSGKRDYGVGETIATQTEVENVSAEEVTFSVQVCLEDLAGTSQGCAAAPGTIASGAVSGVAVSVAGAGGPGSYRLVMSATDGVNVVGEATQDVNVAGSSIVSFAGPTSIVKGQYGRFTFEVANLTPTAVNGTAEIFVLDGGLRQVAKLPSMLVSLEGGATRSLSTDWSPDDSLADGGYSAQLVVSLGTQILYGQSAPFTVLGALPPTPTARNSGPACAGGIVQLEASLVPGGTYSWSGPGGFVSNLQQPIVTNLNASSAGTYDVTVTVAGRTSAPGTTTVVVNAKPVTPLISAPPSAGAGSRFGATVSPHDGATYFWSVAGGQITAGQGTASVEVTADGAGTLILRVTETSPSNCDSDQATAAINILAVPSGLRFHPVTPCRVLDTRLSTGPTAGAPALVSGGIRTIALAGTCGIPGSARALSANITVTGPQATGSLSLFPANQAEPPLSSSINFRAGLTRANNAILTLALDGTGLKVLNSSAGSTEFILDVNGYFE